MVSIDSKELFEKYYQAEYDFNTSSLSEEEIDDIKELVKEKRVNYALAPIGTKVFEWVTEQNPNIHFEFVDFDSERIDGMLYIPLSGSERAYIILNANKPLINQVFTTAHEYYHYIKDYTRVKEAPYICNFSVLENINEKKASRFAAEFLLPAEALRNEIKLYRRKLGIEQSKMSFPEYAAMSIVLTVKYELPLKAVIYRMFEENIIEDIELYIKNYEFIKSVLQEAKICREKVEMLYDNRNSCFAEESIIYRQMKNAYLTGHATRDEVLKDAKELGLDESVIIEFFDEISDDDREDDAEMLAYLSRIWEEK